MANKSRPNIFQILLSDANIAGTDIVNTGDGFFLIYKPISSILSEKNITDSPALSNR